MLFAVSSGKSTTLSMLSGLLPPTSGDALVFGQSILNAMPSIRATLGVCPQHNILFSLLTVKEHLELYAAIKGVERARVAEVVREMIKQVGLEEKVNVRSHALSGGMQRKLSVAIALIGDSRIVFLDEPTSGMDPYSRRATWDMLKKKKEGRVIILTSQCSHHSHHSRRMPVSAAQRRTLLCVPHPWAHVLSPPLFSLVLCSLPCPLLSPFHGRGRPVG